MEFRFQVNDIVVSQPPYSPAVFVITAIEPHRPKNVYSALNAANGKGYRLGDAGLRKIGVALDGWNKVEATPANPHGNVLFEQGRQRAIREERQGGDDQARWALLAASKPGDKIPISLRGRVQQVKLSHVLTGGYKYVFLAENERGTRYRFPVSVILIDGKPGTVRSRFGGGRTLEEML